MNQSISADNPYSRLVALSKLGIVEDFSRIRAKCVTIVGLGGIGSVAAEMLARCGIGKLIVFDYDTVELANMNRMFYLPSQVGLSKVQAAIDTIRTINPDVVMEGRHSNICTIEGYTLLESACATADLLLCCVDNYTARLTINRVCLSLNKVWMESGVSESAVSGHIQTMIPGRYACFECAAPTMVVEGTSEMKREGVCAASLPTTMSIIAGLLVQNCLKYLLEFGEVSRCLGYDALKDFFPSYPLLPNPHCINAVCKKAQDAHIAISQAQSLALQEDTTNRDSLVSVRTENQWGIEIVRDSSDAEAERPVDNELSGMSVKDLVSRLCKGKNK